LIPAEVIFYPVYLGPGVGSAPNRKEYQESFREVKCGQRIRLTALQPYSLKCGILDISHPCGPSQPVTRIASLRLHSSTSISQKMELFELKKNIKTSSG
jgi:hypothetical protein